MTSNHATSQDAENTHLLTSNATRLRIRLTDSAMTLLIAVGGISTILLLLLVVVVLLSTSLPLLSPTRMRIAASASVPNYICFGTDDRELMLWGLDSSGVIHVWEIGAEVELELRPIPTRQNQIQDSVAEEVTAHFWDPSNRFLAVGLGDGTIQFAEIRFTESAVETREAGNASVIFSGRDNELRKVQLDPIEWSGPISVGDGPVQSIDWVKQSGARALLGQRPDRVAVVVGGEAQGSVEVIDIQLRSLLVQEPKVVKRSKLPVRWRDSNCPKEMMLTEQGDQAVIVWENGIVDRFQHSKNRWDLAESHVVTSSARTSQVVTAACREANRRGIALGLSNGQFINWTIAAFNEETSLSPNRVADGGVSSRELGATDGTRLGWDDPQYSLVMNHCVNVSQDPIVALVQQSGSLYFALGSNGSVAAVNPLADRELARVQLMGFGGDPKAERPEGTRLSYRVANMQVSRTADQLLVHCPRGLFGVEFELGGYEATPKTILGKAWYQGYAEPSYVWQSASSRAGSEPKLSLIPLFFGSVKATLFALLFSGPIGVLGAVYASEYLSERTRQRLQALFQIMASLPGVVIGFVVATAVGPWVELWLAEMLFACFLFPLGFYLVGRWWSAIALKKSEQVAEIWRLVTAIALAVFWMAMSCWCAGFVEQRYLGGSIVHWLQSGEGDPFGGLFLFCLAGFATLFVLVKIAWPGLTGRRLSIAALKPLRKLRVFNDLVAIPAAILLVVGFAYCSAWGLAASGMDLRASIFPSYQDRNGLLVGVALSFCTIPVVFLLAVDALRAVPDSQRSAALSCGATKWQSVMTVVLPAASSGILAAILTGVGRVAGETMVVLMVIGNTPLMEWNPFSGLQAITTTLATELPKAVTGSTHYRILFLAALLLFLFTLAINTVAEVIRVRSRSRLKQL
ncbi:MAG: ABC transporter permease subunit [Aureliella sp.]